MEYSLAQKFNFLISVCPFPQFLHMHNIGNVILLANESSMINITELYAQFERDPRVNLVCIISETPYTIKSPIHSHYMRDLTTVSEVNDINEKNFIIDFESQSPDNEIRDIVSSLGAGYWHLSDELIEHYISFVALIQPFLQFCAINPDVPIILYERPVFPPAQERNQNERMLADNKISSARLYNAARIARLDASQDQGMGHAIYDYTNEEFFVMMGTLESKLNSDGIRRFEDFHVGRVNYENGFRVTAFCPKSRERTCYIVGSCVGTLMTIDEETTASVLQSYFNEHGLKIKVENRHLCACGCDEDIIKLMFDLPLKPNDMVILESNLGTTMIHPLFEDVVLRTREIFSSPHKYGEVFFSFEGAGHYNKNGHRELADVLFEHLKSNDFFDRMSNKEIYGEKLVEFSSLPMYNMAPQHHRTNANTELEKYKQGLQGHRAKIGSIVMNCNPFTLGHRYLIEYAAQECSHLYIFVVEEEKSDFTFADRFDLVKKGTADIANVSVIPSGKFIISSLTFVDYFNKSELQDKAIDPTMDLELFATHIAPTLGINLRFAGEEPLDALTKQYNDFMRSILPKYGIGFVEIPRKVAENNTPISASYVRKLLEENDFEAISKLVPKTTLEFLRGRNGVPTPARRE